MPDVIHDANAASKVRMANREHAKIIKKGVEAWNEWRKTDLSLRPNLSGSKLAGMELAYAKGFGVR